MNRTLRCLISLWLLCLSTHSYGEYAFIPATIDVKGIEREISFPEGNQDVYRVVNCSIYLFLNEKVRFPRCYLAAGDESGETYVRAMKNIWKMEFSRAFVHGKPKSVKFHFSVVFKRLNGLESINLKHNIGVNNTLYDSTYIAPQRITRINSTVSLSNCLRDTGLWVKTAVGIDGLPYDTKVVGGVGSDKCKSELLEQFTNFKFIPAMVRSDVVNADYLEYFDCQRDIKRSCVLRSGLASGKFGR